MKNLPNAHKCYFLFWTNYLSDIGILHNCDFYHPIVHFVFHLILFLQFKKCRDFLFSIFTFSFEQHSKHIFAVQSTPSVWRIFIPLDFFGFLNLNRCKLITSICSKQKVVTRKTWNDNRYLCKTIFSINEKESFYG